MPTRPGPAQPPEHGSAGPGLQLLPAQPPPPPQGKQGAVHSPYTLSHRDQAFGSPRHPLSRQNFSTAPPPPLAVRPGQGPALLMVGPASPAPRRGHTEARRPAAQSSPAPRLPPASLPPEQPAPQVTRKPGGCEGGRRGTETHGAGGKRGAGGVGALLPARGAASQHSLYRPLPHLLSGVTMRRGKGGARKRALKVAQMQRDQEKCGRPGSGELPSEATGPRCRRSSGDGRAAQWKGNLLATRLLGRGQGAASRERPSRASPGRGPGIHWHSVAQAVPGDEAVTRSPGQGAPRGPDYGETGGQAPSLVLPGLSMRPPAVLALREAACTCPSLCSRGPRSGSWDEGIRLLGPQDGPGGRSPWCRDRGKPDAARSACRGGGPGAGSRRSPPALAVGSAPSGPWGCWGSARPHLAFTVTLGGSSRPSPRAEQLAMSGGRWHSSGARFTALRPPSTSCSASGLTPWPRGQPPPCGLCSASVLSCGPLRPPRRGQAGTSSRPGLTGAGS